MGYYIYDKDGYVADGPSTGGWQHLRDQVLLPQGGVATREFVRDGATTKVRALGLELARMGAPTKPTATSLAALRDAVERAKGVVVLSDGST